MERLWSGGLQIFNQRKDDLVRGIDVRSNLSVELTKVNSRSTDRLAKYQTVFKLKHQFHLAWKSDYFQIAIHFNLLTKMLFKGLVVVEMTLIVDIFLL